MSEESEAEVKKVNEDVEVLAAEGEEKISLDDFIERLQEMKTKYTASPYTEFSVYAVQKKGAGVLLLSGSRDETNSEREEREQRETLERQRIEQAELKEYLRLKKKYGKKSEQDV